MNDNSPHPARSAEFLSRLHDGELDPAERAHFESHRAHCSECRRAAAEFETALSMYRASRTTPPASDLSARILRRLQSKTPVRQRFGIVHGINLKWAAGFAVAIIATVIGFSIVVERESAKRVALRETPAIPVVLQRGAAPPAKTAAPRNIPARTAGEAAAEKRTDAFAPEAPQAKPEAEAAAPQPGLLAGKKLEKKARVSPQESREVASDAGDIASSRPKELALSAPARREAGGEGSHVSSLASAEPGAPARLVIQALDGEGEAPYVLNPDAAETLSELRGRRYLLLVEASGRVREARLDQPKPPAMSSRSRASAGTIETAKAPDAVWKLRFRPGDRPRRLLLRVE